MNCGCNNFSGPNILKKSVADWSTHTSWQWSTWLFWWLRGLGLGVIWAVLHFSLVGCWLFDIGEYIYYQLYEDCKNQYKDPYTVNQSEEFLNGISAISEISPEKFHGNFWPSKAWHFILNRACTEQKFHKWVEAASECLNIEGFWSPVWGTKWFTWLGVSITETKESIKTLLCKKSHMPSNFLESPKMIDVLLYGPVSWLHHHN